MDRNLRDISDNTQEQVRDNKKKELQLLPDLVRELVKHCSVVCKIKRIFYNSDKL